MDDQNNNEDYDASQALQKARKQAQAQARAQGKDKNKKDTLMKKNGVILEVNNVRAGIPEAKRKGPKNLNFSSALKPGYVLRSKLAGVESSFIVDTKLAPRVFMVKDQKTDKFCAMKIEPYFNEGDVKQLKRDVFVLRDTTNEDQRFTNHFIKLISKGRVADHFNYIITTLCDFNLDELRSKVIKNDFSCQTAARLTLQAFQAVHDMHTLGYLHRNISPSKFMLGLENSKLIYLGGFSTAYRFKKKDGKESRSPKKLFKMPKTRFLPRAYHRFKELSRFDDLESWLYTCVDLFGRKLLPWLDNMDEQQIIANKERFFFDTHDDIFTCAPKQLQIIQRYINKNDDVIPNYTFIGLTLVGMRDKLKLPYNEPFDFQLQQPQQSPNAGGSAKLSAARSRRRRAAAKDATREDKIITKEEKVPNDENSEPESSKRKKKPSHNVMQQGEENVFEEGEAELPQNNDAAAAAAPPAAKPPMNALQALSMARKKKLAKGGGAIAKAAEMDNGGEHGSEGPFKAVDPMVVNDLKKKRLPAPTSPHEEEGGEDENGSDKRPQAQLPQPVIFKPKKKKSGKTKHRKKKTLPTVAESPRGTPPPPVRERTVVEKEGAEGGGDEEEGGGGASNPRKEEEKDDGGYDNMKPDL